MKNAVRNIKGFLESKGVEWVGNKLFDSDFAGYREAKDEDFDEQAIETVKLKNSKGEILTKQILVTDNLFLIFRAVGTKLEADLSNEWITYQKKVKYDEAFDKLDDEAKERLENFREYLKEDINE